jgi:predicted chitinase
MFIPARNTCPPNDAGFLPEDAPRSRAKIGEMNEAAQRAVLAVEHMEQALAHLAKAHSLSSMPILLTDQVKHLLATIHHSTGKQFHALDEALMYSHDNLKHIIWQRDNESASQNRSAKVSDQQAYDRYNYQDEYDSLEDLPF